MENLRGRTTERSLPQLSLEAEAEAETLYARLTPIEAQQRGIAQYMAAQSHKVETVLEEIGKLSTTVKMLTDGLGKNCLAPIKRLEDWAAHAHERVVAQNITITNHETGMKAMSETVQEIRAAVIDMAS